jgi:hypothetical protein
MANRTDFRSPPHFVAKARSWCAGEEPALAEVMADPIVHLVMARDKLSWDDMERAIARGQRQLRSRLCCLHAA